ncbi:zinc-binding alcohol dehydrogenase family protein [Streptomyces sp. NPDC007901]|uniref:zinc-binding alcohol dehydrogenase family protein n=1 Tax=Streptomyces sp. NPDC007901 TaxID=3364785 RepID=UPI0036E60416
MGGTMTGIVAQGGRGAADPDAFLTRTLPTPGLRPRDLLVRVHAVSTNPVDAKLHARMGQGESRVLGYDAAGTVEAIGADVTEFAVGERVYYAGDVTRDGTNATYHAVDARLVGRMPRGLTFAEAAALPLTTITAWEALFDHFGLSAESTGTLLVLAGAGGVGSIALQLAKRLTNLRVIATASRPESRAWALAHGADHVVDHHDLVKEVKRAAPLGVDYILAPHTEGNVQAFAEIAVPFGRVAALDSPTALDILPLKDKSVTWHWVKMFTRPMFETQDMAAHRRLLDRTAELVEAGTIRTTMATTLHGITTDTIRRAHLEVLSGRTVGKIVLTATW